MKRITAAVFLLCFSLYFLVSQETPENEVPAGRETAESAPKKWYEHFEGITVSLEAGSHEYPLSEWYPGQSTEGYSVRSFYVKPGAAYKRAIKDFNIQAELDLTVDMGAPDPKIGAAAVNAKTADRQNWFTFHLEEEVDYPVSALFEGKFNFPGSLSVYMNNCNYFYVLPAFPGANSMADGVLEPGVLYSYDKFRIGKLYGKMGVPVRYVNRMTDGIGLGHTFTAGYKDGYGLNLGVELMAEWSYLPSVSYDKTGLTVMYGWNDLSAELEVVSYGAFTSVSINPEFVYHFSAFNFNLGIEVTNIGKAVSFSPHLGLSWSY
jgi:hypothetical protein